MAKKTDDEGTAVPVRIEDVRYPDGVPVIVSPENAPEPSGSGSKSGQKATNQKKEG